MPLLSISEYGSTVTVGGHALPIADEPCVKTQALEIGPDSVVSETFQSATKFVRLHAEVDCAIAFGPAPEAYPTATRISAGATEIFGVMPGMKLAVIAVRRESPMDAADGVFALLKVASDPEVTGKRLQELAEATKQADERTQIAKDLLNAVRKREQAVAEQEVDLATAQKKVADDRQELMTIGTASSRKATLLINREETLRCATAAHETAKATAQVEHESRVKEFNESADAKSKELQKREEKLQAREAEVERRESDTALLKKQYDARMTKLKEIAG